jgi:hypothetical protein
MQLALHLLVALASLVCFIIVVMKMFQHGQTGLGIVCILLVWCVGGLIAFIYGWVKAGEWNIKNVMLLWTVLIIVGLVLNVAMPLDLTFIRGG